MAILNQPPPRSGVKIEGTAPTGQYLARCIKVHDQFGVDRKKYQSQEMEKQDVTRFYLGVKAKDGKKYVVSTKEFKISGNEKSGLYKFLSAWNGAPFPYGTDYVAWGENRGAMISVTHTQGDSKTFVNITTIAPVMEGLEAKVPQGIEFDEFLDDDANGDTNASKESKEAAEEDSPF